MSSASATPVSSRPQTGPVLGGEAWIVPFEAGGPVWVTASAPAIAVMDRRPAGSEPAQPRPLVAR